MKKIKFVAPIIITLLLCVYFFAFMMFFFWFDFPWNVKILGALLPAALLGVAIYVFVQRVNEIRKGEE
ncbi:MAG: hypothetical protein RR075_05535, partial [Pygmaiobacter sp.]